MNWQISICHNIQTFTESEIMCAFKRPENGVKQYMQLQCSANSLTRVLLMHVMKVFADADDTIETLMLRKIMIVMLILHW